MFDLIGGIRGIIAAVSGAVLMFVALGAYDRLIDDPAVARAAREGFVALSEKVALTAKLDAETRRRAAVEAAGADSLGALFMFHFNSITIGDANA